VTVPDLLSAELRRDAARPFLTWYDDATGERIELSVATIANWAAKTANALADEYGLEPGDAVRLSPADHWLSPVVAFGAWTLGVRVNLDDRDHVAVSLPGDPAEFTASVLPQPDALTTAPASPVAAALRCAGRTWAADALAAAAKRAADLHDVTNGARILSTLSLDSLVGMDASLLVPLAAGGSVVWCVNADESRLADRAATERVTVTAGVAVAGLPRLDY
jgi:acyl-coenzyme A synthetase/AMP-(fatty) acid ligase